MAINHIIIVLSVLLGLWQTFTLVSSSVEIHLTFGKPYYPNDTKFFDLNKVRVKKINRTHHVIDGEMEFFRSFGDEYDVEVTFYQKSGIEYKKMPYKIGPKKFCSFFREEKTVYPDLQKHTDLPPIDTCPWPKQIYHYYSYIFKVEKVPPIFPDGEYMGQWVVLRDGNIVNGYIVFLNMENKKFLPK